MTQERATLEQAAQALGLALDATALDRLSGYLALLRKWNQIHNLTAVRDPAQMLQQHLFDSLAIVRPLERMLAAERAATEPVVATGLRLLDVGSGAGLPGAVLAIVRPGIRVDCIDAVAKKSAFVRQVALELQLTNLVARHGRVEQLARQQSSLKFDVVTSRAFASLERLVRLTDEVLAERGFWLAMKAHLPADEVRAVPDKIDMFHVEHLDVPKLNATRCIVWMRRRMPTVDQAP